MHEPWVDKKSILDITRDARKTAGLEALDMGYVYFFKNKETRHCNNDEEAYQFYDKNKERLDKEPE